MSHELPQVPEGPSYTDEILIEMLKVLREIAHNTRTAKIEPEDKFRTFGEDS